WSRSRPTHDRGRDVEESALDPGLCGVIQPSLHDEEERMAVAVDPRLEEIQKIARGRGVEFFFAQFVDMYGRPSAKLVPARNLESLVTDGAVFAGFAAGEIGQAPSDPDIAAMPDLDSLTLVPWQPNLA